MNQLHIEEAAAVAAQPDERAGEDAFLVGTQALDALFDALEAESRFADLPRLDGDAASFGTFA